MKGARKGLNGVDFAFYQKRAVYHTPRDSIWEMGTEGARKSLWAMMDGARGAGISMLNDARPTNGDDPAVYFDILGRKLVVFPLRYLLFGNIALLVLAPASILVLLGMVAAITMTKKYEGAYPSPTTWWRIQAVLPASVGLGRFWIALLATTLGQAGLVLAYVQYNPFVIHSHANMVVIASLTLSYLASVVPLQFSQAYSPHPPNSQKLVILLELFFFTWILLVIATFAVVRYEAGGVYFVTPWYICTWAATISGLFEAAWSARDGADIGSRRFDVVADHGPHEKHADNILYDENLGTMNETTPLIRPLQISYNGRESVFNAAGGIKGVQTSVLKDAIVAENTWWIVQMLLLIPFPVLLMFELQTLLVHTLRNSPVDGNSPVPVYGGLSLFSILITINVAPFAHKLHRLLTVAMIVALFVTAIYTIAAAPFTVQFPLKVFFQQKVELVLPSAAHPQGYVFSARTFISAPNGTSEDRVVPQLPNSRGKNISCAIATTSRAGLQTCSWDSSDLLPSPGGDTPGNLELAPPSPMASSTATRATDWFDVNITRQGPYNATISVRGTNTRACRLQFTSSIITSYHVHGSPEHLQPGYDAPDYGINDLVLWSREWDNVFVVDIEWTGSTALQGSVGCAWAEYVSAAVGTEWAPKSARIPALEELFLFFRPEYSPIKWSSGLVEVAANFTVSS